MAWEDAGSQPWMNRLILMVARGKDVDFGTASSQVYAHMEDCYFEAKAKNLGSAAMWERLMTLAFNSEEP